MNIKEDPKNPGTYRIAFSKRNPITKQAVTLVRKGFTNKAEASRAYRQLVVDVEERIKRTYTPKWDELVDAWARAVREKDIFAGSLSENTLQDYLMVLYNYTKPWQDKFVSDISKTDAWTLLNQIESSISKARAKRVRSAIDNVFKWAMLSGKLNDVRSISTEGYSSTRKDEEKMPEILTLDEIRTFLKYARSVNHPWFPVWAVALYTGMRSGELYALTWDQIDFEAKVLFIHRNWTNKTGFGPTKGRYWRTVPISPELVTLLKALRLSSKGSEFVLPRFRSWEDGEAASILREFLVGMGLPSVRFHTLRACFATQLLRDSVSPAVIMKICGWKDLKTMARYVRIAGIEVKGATEGLKLLSESDTMGRVVELFNQGGS